MIEKFLEFFKGLLPDENLPTTDYIIRLVINFSVLIGTCVLIYVSIDNTLVADRMGLSKMVKEIPLITHVDLLRDFQTSRQVVKQFSDTYDEIKATFIILFVDKSGNVVRSNPKIDNTDTLIWTVTTYKGGEDNLYILDTTIRKFKPRLIERLGLGCYSDALKNTTLVKDRTLQLSNISHFVACPITSKRNYLIGFTLSFISFPQETERTGLTTPVNPSDKEHIIAMWAFEDRLLRLTKTIEAYFRGFEVIYRIYYN